MWHLWFHMCQPRVVFLASTLSLFAAVVSVTAPSGPTEVKPVQVEIDSPEGCGSAEDFFVSLRSRTSLVRKATDGEPRTTLHVRLLGMRHHVLGELRMVSDRGGTDTRRVQGPNCEDVLQALSLAAAVALDPSVLLPPIVTTPAPAPTVVDPSPPALSLPESKSAAPPKAVDAPPSPISPGGSPFELGAAAAGATLLSSGPSPGLSIFGRWTPAGSGAFQPTVGMAVTHFRNDILMSPGAAQSTLTGLAVTVCGAGWRGSLIGVKPCLLGMAGVLSVSGQHVARVSTVDVFWISAGAVMRTAFRLGGGFSLDLEAGASMPFIRREFYTTLPSHVVAKTAVISPVVGLGISYNF